MRKLATFALAAALTMSLTACGGSTATDGTGDSGGGEEATETAPISGGWETNTEIAGKMITEEQAGVFQQALAEMVGVDYEPVAVIGEQVVAGTNYAYLCKAVAVTPGATPEWVVVVIYEDLEGNASFTCANPIDLADPQLVFSEKGEVVGGWSVPEPSDGVSLPADADAAFYAATADLPTDEEGCSVAPIALLGTQVVAGTNYQVLCLGSENGVENAPYELFDVIVYEDLDGKAELTSIDRLDLDYYVTPPAED